MVDTDPHEYCEDYDAAEDQDIQNDVFCSNGPLENEAACGTTETAEVFSRPGETLKKAAPCRPELSDEDPDVLACGYDDIEYGVGDDVQKGKAYEFAKLFYRKTRINPNVLEKAAIEYRSMRVKDEFRMMYCATEEMLAFQDVLRPLIALHGTFSKRKVYGNHVIMLAAASSGNNNVAIMAFAIAPSESEESWCLFLRHLRASYPKLFEKKNSVGLISGAQKGLENALNTEMSDQVHFACFKHLMPSIKNYPPLKGDGKKIAEVQERVNQLVTSDGCDSAQQVKIVEHIQWLRDNVPPPRGTNPTYLLLTDPDWIPKWVDAFRDASKFNCVTSNYSEQINKCLVLARELNWFQSGREVIAQQKSFIAKNEGLLRQHECFFMGNEGFTLMATKRVINSEKIISEDYKVTVYDNKKGRVDLVQEKYDEFYNPKGMNFKKSFGKILSADPKAILTELKRAKLTNHLKGSFFLHEEHVSKTRGLRLHTWNSKQSYDVDLEARTCTCGYFQNDQFPCPHALAVIYRLNLNPVDFAHYSYTVHGLLEAIYRARERSAPTDMPISELLEIVENYILDEESDIDASFMKPTEKARGLKWRLKREKLLVRPGILMDDPEKEERPTTTRRYTHKNIHCKLPGFYGHTLHPMDANAE